MVSELFIQELYLHSFMENQDQNQLQSPQPNQIPLVNQVRGLVVNQQQQNLMVNQGV